MEDITYQVAGIEDTETLVEYRLVFARELAGEKPPELIADLRKQMTGYFKKATASGDCVSVIARSGDAIAGIGTVHFRELPGNFKNPSGKWGYVMNMYTVPEFRRRGICGAILEKLVVEGRKKGITAFELHATTDGEPVYKKGGFEIHNEPTYRKFV